ncbi:hypothetical protein [Streptomyces sp. I8-5]|uniref:hypothetical protein n=1 Tax=Streptomyces sp. I8-5 TaxID=3104277 RepID=UPI00386ECBF9
MEDVEHVEGVAGAACDDQGLYVPSGNAAPTVEWHPAWTNIENKGTGFTENGRYVLNGDTIIFWADLFLGTPGEVSWARGNERTNAPQFTLPFPASHAAFGTGWYNTGTGSTGYLYEVTAVVKAGDSPTPPPTASRRTGRLHPSSAEEPEQPAG